MTIDQRIGTAAAALLAMREAGFDAAVGEGLAAASAKAAGMSKA